MAFNEVDLKKKQDVFIWLRFLVSSAEFTGFRL